MKNINESQAPYCDYSHKGAPCWDDCGLDEGIEYAFAPFSMKYVGIDSVSRANACIFHSLDKVLCADGYKRLLTLVCLHMDNVGGFYEGQIFKTGQPFYKEGRAGKATGNHIHFELAEGHQTVRRENIYGTRIIRNALDPCNLFFIDKNIHKIINTAFIFKYTNTIEGGQKTIMKIKIIKSSFKDGSGYAVRPFPYSKEICYTAGIGTVFEIVDIKSYATKANELSYAYLVLADGNYIQYDSEYIEILNQDQFIKIDSEVYVRSSKDEINHG